MCKSMKEFDFNTWMISYLEGTRMSKSKLELAQTFARENKMQVLNHVLIPRTKGFVCAMDAMSDWLEAVYDFTVWSKEGAPTLWDLLTPGANKIVYVHVDRFEFSEIPTETKEIKDWVQERWRVKENRIQHQINTGKMDDNANRNLPLF
eukprot:TRINITY_DN41_c0_g1_i2.p1 TRINITY_DN41_c0_g1~~TRINITY_DN41_c0_g1_i2.p1  ORF type:complete len:149 (-),score=38.80 TRINITY_DN41_c0_g1_i2:610-1056(-)